MHKSPKYNRPFPTSPTRIIITGASGVGKTTLAGSLAPLLSLPLIPELARDMCAQMGYQRIGDIPDQEEFKRHVLKAQIDLEEELGNFISDRSTIDCWVLWQRWNLNHAMTYDTEAYYVTARAQAALYSHIIYVPPHFPPAEDGFRWTDLDYQKQIDRLVRMSLFEWDLLDRTLFITGENLNERVAQVMGWMGIEAAEIDS